MGNEHLYNDVLENPAYLQLSNPKKSSDQEVGVYIHLWQNVEIATYKSSMIPINARVRDTVGCSPQG